MPVTYSVCPHCQSVNKINFEAAEAKKPTCGSCHTELDFHDGVTNLSADQVQKLIRSSPLPVVIDFWAPWCGPCRSFAPTFSEAAQSLRGQFVFVKVNTEQHPQASTNFGVRGIPTITVFEKGQEVGRQAGALPREYFAQWLRQSLR